MHLPEEQSILVRSQAVTLEKRGKWHCFVAQLGGLIYSNNTGSIPTGYTFMEMRHLTLFIVLFYSKKRKNICYVTIQQEN